MHPVSRFVAPLAVLVAIDLFAIAFTTDPNLYTSVLTHWMRLPYERPFMDWEAMPAAIECWGRGVDVYVDLPCYRPGKSVVHNYSPLWLRFAFLPTDPASVQVQETPTRLGRVVISVAYLAVPFILWRMGIQGLISDLAPDGPKLSDETAIAIVYWLADESLWWWIVGVLGSAVIGFVSTSSAAEALFAGLHRRRLRAQAAPGE